VTAELKPETVQAFDRYIREAENAVQSRVQNKDGFLWAGDSPERLRRVRAGEVIAEPKSAKGEIKIPSGLIHDWTGSVFIPGAKLDQVLAMVQNYDRHREIYKPEVIDSRTVSRSGNDFRVYLRLLKKKVLTVVLNTEHQVRYFPLDATRAHSFSHTTRIAEVDNAGTAGERELPFGKDHGFLWRLYSYWRFQEKDGGVYVECQAISLTRDVPMGLGWLIDPIIRNLPRESLVNTLAATRAAARQGR
jgi:hypothetical protein